MSMGIETLISVAEYLDGSYKPDCHYVAGHLVERDVGEKEHGRMQRALLWHLRGYQASGLEAWPEQRIQISADHYRVVDVCITEGEPEGQIFTAPPLVCIEILSRKDSLSEIQEVIDDYVRIGVPYNWIINPWKRITYIGSARGFDKVADQILRTSSPHPEIVIPVAELYGR
jgi:Uma2 family endonuclease